MCFSTENASLLYCISAGQELDLPGFPDDAAEINDSGTTNVARYHLL
jgi:hypothetical protein